MEIALGALGALVVVLLYDKFKGKKRSKDVIDFDTKKREKEISDHFQALLNYTPEQAYKKVK